MRAYYKPWMGGRVVECSGLENRRRVIPFRGFESHPIRGMPGEGDATVRYDERRRGLPWRMMCRQIYDISYSFC